MSAWVPGWLAMREQLDKERKELDEKMSPYIDQWELFKAHQDDEKFVFWGLIAVVVLLVGASGFMIWELFIK